MIVPMVIKQGDTRPIVADTLTYSDGTTVDLTGATVRFVMRSVNGAVTINQLATIVTPTSPASIRYVLTPTDSAVVGSYHFEWHVTFADASLMKFPTEGYNRLVIEPDLLVAMQTYADVDTLKSYLGITVQSNDIALDMAISAASRSIEAYCQRRFWLDPAPVTRTFVPQTLLDVNLNTATPVGGDIATKAGLVVKTDPSGSGQFSVTWAATDFQLLPADADTSYPEARPWTALRAIGTKTFPWLINTWLTRLDRLQITAQWGWPQVPAAVTQACLIKASRLYHRKDSPQGVTGFAEFGPIRISNREDPDVVGLLASYRRYSVLVG